jgi:hypothetical protein
MGPQYPEDVTRDTAQVRRALHKKRPAASVRPVTNRKADRWSSEGG